LQAPCLAFQLLDLLVKIERAQRRGRPHAGVDQHEHREDRSVRILLHEVKAEIDHRQKREVGHKAVDEA
jgi:hypothetical protein